MSAIFKTVSWRTDQLVAGVQKGTIQLPDLQRPFVWPATKVRDLLDSMYKGFPVGSLMFWDVAAQGETRSIAAGSALGASHQIIDGQQRLTSLYAATQGLPILDENYRSKRIVISFNPFDEKFEVRSPFLARSPQWVGDISACFENPIAARRAFIQRIRDSGEELTEAVEERIEVVLARLAELKNYAFDVVHIQQDVEKRTVADIFVRINSEGVRLKAYDFILTWLSVFWPEGRDKIEEFARHSRISPQRASEISGRKIAWTAQNPFLDVDTGHVVRAIVAVGQRRGRLQDSYAALQAKDRATGRVDSARQEAELALLKDALPIVTDRTSWNEYIHAIQVGGFRSKKNITSTTNLVYTYVLFLIGRHRFKMDLTKLRTLIARWLFMAQLTSRYTASGESQIQKDLDRLEGIPAGDVDAFERVLERIIGAQLTSDFWHYALPQELISSGAAISPAYQCYLAALNVLDADMFMLDMKVSTWMDPSVPAIKGLEGHHLFPRKHLDAVRGVTDIKRINQVANFAPTDWSTNIKISDQAPAAYWPGLVAERSHGAAWLRQQMYWHALPQGWETMDYGDFLSARRDLIAQVTKDGFDKLAQGLSSAPIGPVKWSDRPAEPTLSDLLDRRLLNFGDLLDPIDPDWVVDAVVTDDGMIRIDGTHDFDSLDEAAMHLGVTNVSGFEFWALEDGDFVRPLTELVGQARTGVS